MTNFEDTDPNGATIQLFTLQKSNKVIATSANTSKHLVDRDTNEVQFIVHT